MLRSFLFFISIFSGLFILITPLTPLQATPTGNNSPQTEQKTTGTSQATTKNTEKKEEKKIDPAYAKMTQSQLNQVKRYDCRLPKELVSHDYNAQKEKASAPEKMTQKDASKPSKTPL
ncbi:hypothetical protein [Candidatus Electrothrix sp.]|uniref:hypothetical protein n=1 Tax=Candidatus Electrothrix sp. TaxID=2170559 RepID=UPI004055BB72